MAARRTLGPVGKVTAGIFSAVVMGVLMGGLYSRPIARLTKGREPWASLALGAALAVTVFGLGIALRVNPWFLAGIWLVSAGFLAAARKSLGPFGRDRGKFGIAHAVALLLTFLAGGITRHGLGGGTRDFGGAWTLKR